MAHLTCKCGRMLSNGAGHKNPSYRIYSAEEWDKIGEKDEWKFWELPRSKHNLWLCPNCKRLYWFEDGSDISIRYRVEES